jgi:hypothetical protein
MKNEKMIEPFFSKRILKRMDPYPIKLEDIITNGDILLKFNKFEEIQMSQNFLM